MSYRFPVPDTEIDDRPGLFHTAIRRVGGPGAMARYKSMMEADDPIDGAAFMRINRAEIAQDMLERAGRATDKALAEELGLEDNRPAAALQAGA